MTTTTWTNDATATRAIDHWIDAYGESHRNPLNKRIHRVAVPLIVFNALGFFAAIPWATTVAGVPVSGATIVALAGLAYYARLSAPLGAGMTVLVIPMLAALAALQPALGGAFVPAMVALFVVLWAAQFYGHHVEGRKPSFLKDLQFLMIGPLWILADAYRRLGWSY